MINSIKRGSSLSYVKYMNIYLNNGLCQSMHPYKVQVHSVYTLIDDGIIITGYVPSLHIIF